MEECDKGLGEMTWERVCVPPLRGGVSIVALSGAGHVDRGRREGAWAFSLCFRVSLLSLLGGRICLAAVSLPVLSSVFCHMLSYSKTLSIVKVSWGANLSTLIDFYKFAEDSFESLKLR